MTETTSILPCDNSLRHLQQIYRFLCINTFLYTGKVLFGCIYDPFRNEMFTAWEGQGAHLNGKRIHCCGTPTMASSVVTTGSPPNLASLAACLRATMLISAEVRTVRMLGRYSQLK